MQRSDVRLAQDRDPEKAGWHQVRMNLPGYHFHALRGVRRWSVRVTGNWRITFGWSGIDAIDVDLEDYH